MVASGNYSSLALKNEEQTWLDANAPAVNQHVTKNTKAIQLESHNIIYNNMIMNVREAYISEHS